MLGFHSIRADMSRRARCGIPQRLISFQPCALGAKRLRSPPSFGMGKRHFSQRAPCPLVNTSGLCQNNANVRRLPTGSAVYQAPVAAAHAKSSFSLWTRHYRKCGLVSCKRLTLGAAHCTPRHTQSAFQYWGVSVIPLVASDFTGSAVSGERGASASLPQAPSLAAGAAHR